MKIKTEIKEYLKLKSIVILFENSTGAGIDKLQKNQQPKEKRVDRVQ